MSSINNTVAKVIAGLFILGSALISLNRYWQYEVDYYDFGILDTAIWKVSRWSAPIVDHFVVENKWIFADHFYPSLMLLAPLYWFTQHQEIMFIVQSLSVGLAGLVLYRIAQIQIKSSFAALSVLVSFYSFIGLQNALWFDIHEVTFMVLPLALLFYAVVIDSRLLYWLVFCLILGFKESAFVILLGTSFYFFVTHKSWRRTASLSAVLAVIYGIVVIKVVIPFFADGSYFYSEIFSYNWFDPRTYLEIFTDNAVKINTMATSFKSFGFMPIVALPLWPAYLLHFVTRFTSNPIRWDIGLHYSAELAPLLSFGCIYTLNRFGRLKKRWLLVSASIWLFVVSFFLFRFVYHGPFLLAINPAFYQQTKLVNYPEKIISQVPASASVMGQQNLITHLNHRNTAWVLRDNYEKYAPDYIVIDIRDGLNVNHYWGISDLDSLWNKLTTDPNYQITAQYQTVYLFKKSPIIQ